MKNYQLEYSERIRKIRDLDAAKGKLNIRKIPLDDKKTWDLICSGFTKGVFQLEGSLGRRYAKEVKPRNIEELSDLVSLIRPGCLEAEFREKEDEPGKFSSITHTYIKVKDGVWSPEYIHPVLEPIFKETYSVPIYQEQVMRICTDFAGFTLKEADDARKAVGKKKADVMAKVKVKFLEGAKKNGHPEELAETVFSWIEKFSGYGFNKSHGISYALNAYRTAYCKANYPLAFFKAMLTNSDGKQDSLEEIQELVYEAKLFNISVCPPRLDRLNKDFSVVDGDIVFGLGHIKGVGASAFNSLKKLAKAKSGIEFLSLAFGKETKVNKGVVIALIKSGSVDYLRMKRVELLYWYTVLGILTERERAHIFESLEKYENVDLWKAYDLLMASKIPNKSRKPRIEAAILDVKRDLGGNPKKMCIAWEQHFLGVPLSGNKTDLYYNPEVNIKLKNIQRLSNKTQGAIGVVIEKIKKIKDKNHNEMCFLTVTDDTYISDSVVVFASTYTKCGWIIEEGKPVLIHGRVDRGSFLVNRIDHL